MHSEKAFEMRIKKFLADEGCWFVKFFANRNTKSGIPDLLCCINGYFVAVEVKGDKGKVSDLQLWNKNKIQDSDGFCVVLYPDEFDKFIQLVKELKQNNLAEAMDLENLINDRR